MSTDIVDADGSQVPIDRLMMHHIVFINYNKFDRTCSGKGVTCYDERHSSGAAMP